MTANPTPRAVQVIVVLGQADDALALGLRSVGLAPVAQEGDVAIWKRQPMSAAPPISTPPEPAQSDTRPAGLLMTIADAALALGIGRSTVYELIAKGQLEVVHVGRSARVPTQALHALVGQLRTNPNPHEWRRAAG